jgi:WD40 repeat protein
VLSDHGEEVWYCRFSPDGLKLATGSKDNAVIIWDFDPDKLMLKPNKTLERRSHGISYFAWSPDSTRLAVCGSEDCDEVDTNVALVPFSVAVFLIETFPNFFSETIKS